MTRHFARYLAIPDGIGTSAVLDRTTDRVVNGTQGLPPADAEQLARDWSRHEPPKTIEIPAACVHSDGTEHPAPSDLVWDSAQQRWVRMYHMCEWSEVA